MSLIYNLGKSSISESGVKDIIEDLKSCIKTLEIILIFFQKNIQLLEDI